MEQTCDCCERWQHFGFGGHGGKTQSRIRETIQS
jgi:hypothetical protein